MITLTFEPVITETLKYLYMSLAQELEELNKQIEEHLNSLK